MKHIILFFILAMAFLAIRPIRVSAQHPDALLQLARANNQELEALKRDYQAALEKAPQLSQLPNPELGIGAFIRPVETRLGPQRARAGVNQMFPWFGTLPAQKDWALAEAQAKFERMAVLEMELRYHLSEAYFRLYALDATQVLLRENLVLLQALKGLAETKVATGQSSLADVLRLDLRLNELTQRIAIFENRKRAPQARINQILFRSLDTPIQVQETLAFAAFPWQRDSLLAQTSRAHPMLRMYTLQQGAARAAIQVNALQGKPSFGVGADYIYTDPRSDAFPDQNGRDAFLLRATISLPLYRQKYQARAREEKQKIEALEARKAESMHRFEAMIEMAYAAYEEATLEWDLYQRQIQTTRAALDLMEAAYTAHSRGFEDLLQLEQSLLDYQLKQLQALVKSHTASAELMRYVPF